MRYRRRYCLSLLLLQVLLCTTSFAQETDEPVFLLQSASGTYEVDGENLLIIQDVEGTLSIRAATDETLRFEGRSMRSSRDLQEVALWRSGEHTLLLGPGADVPDEGTLVDMVLPGSLDLEVVLNGGRLLISAIEGDLLVEAEGTKVQARGLNGGAEFLLVGGLLKVDGVKGTLGFEGTDVDAEFLHLYDEAELVVTGGKTRVNGSTGSVAVEAAGTELQLDAVQGEINVTLEGGSLRAGGCAGGGEVRLEGALLTLLQTKGDLQVRTDADVEFAQHEGSLSVFSYGAPIRGSQIAGPLTIESSNSTVELEQNSGSTTIRGSDLDVKVRDCQGPVNVQTVSSEIAVDRTKNQVVVENDYGDVQVNGTDGPATITSRGGIVQVTDHKGPLELRADGPEVRIAWEKFTSTDAMNVRNESGDVHVDLPASGRCNLQLKAAFGRIDTALTGLRIAEDGHSGGGEFTGGKGKAPSVKKPTIQVVSGGGNIYLGTTAAKE